MDHAAYRLSLSYASNLQQATVAVAEVVSRQPVEGMRLSDGSILQQAASAVAIAELVSNQPAEWKEARQPAPTSTVVINQPVEKRPMAGSRYDHMWLESWLADRR